MSIGRDRWDHHCVPLSAESWEGTTSVETPETLPAAPVLPYVREVRDACLCHVSIRRLDRDSGIDDRKLA